MKIVLQRVSRAQVRVEEKVVGSIAGGFVLLVGIAGTDTKADAEWLAEKILKLRLFSGPEDSSFMQASILGIQGELLVISQFTLYGDCRKGTKPSFTDAARPEVAEPLYQYFVGQLRNSGLHVATGNFGAHMEVELVNDGPVTLVVSK